MISVAVIAACSPIPATGRESVLSDEALEIEALADEAMAMNSVSVRDQLIRAGSVVIDQVVSDGPGWIVIHADNGGAPGAVIGFRFVANGLNSNVEVMIDEAFATDVLFAMLHIDAGELSAYEFPGDDIPATRDGSVVLEAFSIT